MSNFDPQTGQPIQPPSAYPPPSYEQPAGYGQQPTGLPYAPPVAYSAYQAGPMLPQGVVLASKGRRVGAYFLSLLLAICTLGIGYIIWGAIVWGKGTSPAFQVLGMRVWKPNEGRVATWGGMALRDIVGGICQGILGWITGLVSLIMFLVDDQNRNIMDRVGSTIIVHDPNKVLG